MSPEPGLYYPEYKQGGDIINSRTISIEDNDYYYDTDPGDCVIWELDKMKRKYVCTESDPDLSPGRELDFIANGINFHFGADSVLCIKWECRKIIGRSCRWKCVEYQTNEKNYEEIDIPIGIRSIGAGGKTYIFPVEPTGNWVGTVK